MIINIRQLSSNIKQEYLIDGDFSCRGKLGGFNRFQKITLSAQNQLYSHDKFNYISVYLGETQIALIETYLVVNDLKYKHKIYLLDDYENLKEILALFVLYYANYNFTKRFHMSAGVFTTKSFAYSKYKDKYSPSWQMTNFPNDNFWGKTNLYN